MCNSLFYIVRQWSFVRSFVPYIRVRLHVRTKHSHVNAHTSLLLSRSRVYGVVCAVLAAAAAGRLTAAAVAREEKITINSRVKWHNITVLYITSYRSMNCYVLIYVCMFSPSLYFFILRSVLRTFYARTVQMG